MAIFDPGPRQISDYISDINQLIISLNQSNSISLPLVLRPSGAAEMLASLNQVVQGLNNAGISIPLFNGPQDTSAFLSLINTLNILGGTGKSVAVLPAGALGVWYASDYATTPRKMIKNRVTNGAPDSNLLTAPRRLFNNGFTAWQTAGTFTLADANAVAPDGSNDASTVTATAGNSWGVQSPTAFTIPAGTYTLAISVKNISGAATFKFGESVAGVALFTANGSWQRFTKTITSAGGTVQPIIISPDGTSATVMQFCDFQMFAGSADLNPFISAGVGNPPLSVKNLDLIVGSSNFDTASVVSGGVLQHGSTSAVQFLSAQTPSAFTVVYVAKRAAAASSPNYPSYEPILTYAASNAYTKFAIGPMYAGNMGSSYNATSLDATYDGQTTNTVDLFAQIGSGPFFVAHRFTGTRSSIFANKTKLYDNAVSPGTTSFSDLWVGVFDGNITTGFDIYALAYYPRALSDAEVLQAYNALQSVATFTPELRTIAFEGTSITSGPSPTVNWPNLFAPNSVVPFHGVNGAVGGSAVASAITRAPGLDAIIAGSTNKCILTVEEGANDINVSSTATFLSNLASYCDARRAAGWKVVLATILPRLGAPNGGAAFNTARAIANTEIKLWKTGGSTVPGIHCDAIADVASDATMGPDNAPTNTTYYNADQIHPTQAGMVLLEPYYRNAINGL